MNLPPEEITPELFINASNLTSLARNFASVQEIAECWQKVARAKIEANTTQLYEQKPELLDFLQIEHEGVSYQIYGVIHGWTGGVSAEYRALVQKSLQFEPEIIYEKMLGRFYGSKGAIETSDFCVLRRRGQFMLGLRMMLVWPLFLAMAVFEIGKELFTKKHNEAADNDYNNIHYHNIDRELRRGLDGSLPTRLQIEYEMNCWHGWRGFWDMDLLMRVVPRSAYLAEFARQWAREKGLHRLAIVVGDRHLTEVRHFLEHPTKNHWLIQTAQRHARQQARSRLWYYWHFFRYMLVTTLGSLIGAFPWLAVFWVLLELLSASSYIHRT